ncbi:ribonuclease E inhibitor RraB [Phyllobacterium sp. 22552]
MTLIRSDIPDNIDEVIWPLYNLAKDNNADYDGWGSVAASK